MTRLWQILIDARDFDIDNHFIENTHIFKQKQLLDPL